MSAKKEETRALGYLCPACQKSVIGEPSVFALSASGAAVTCSCGKSALTAVAGERGFTLHVPCGVCGGEHDAVVEAERFLRGPGIGLACSRTKRLCCFAGRRHEVERQLEHLRIAAGKESEDELFADSVIMSEVLSELKEIASRPHGISCNCGCEQYRMEIRPTYVDLTCADCGAKLRVDAATDEDLDSLCCHWTLRIPGR